MKKLFALILASMLTLSFTACGDADDATKSTAMSKATSVVDGSKAENKLSVVGLWQSEKTVGDALGERFEFNQNGEFVYGSSETGELNRELYKAGTYSVVDGKLKLEVKTRWVIPVGDIADIEQTDDIIVLGEGLLKLISKPSEEEVYDIATAPGSENKNQIIIDGVTFYNFDGNTNLFKAFKELPTERLKIVK